MFERETPTQIDRSPDLKNKTRHARLALTSDRRESKERKSPETPKLNHSAG
jgi:hypothetical protein